MANRQAAPENQCKYCGARDARKGEEESGMKERKEIPVQNTNSFQTLGCEGHAKTVMSQEQ